MRILDVATGTGMVAFALAGRGAEVVGLDQSEEMLDAARARLQRTPKLAERLSFVLGEAEALPFARWRVRRALVHIPAALRR